MNFIRCTSFAVQIFFFITKVRAEEPPEEEDFRKHVEDIPLRTRNPQNNTTSIAAAPVQSMYPYPYNFYYPNPYTLYSPYMYNYQRSPYIQPSQQPTETSAQIYSLNPTGYPVKIVQKFVNDVQVHQDNDLQIPSQMYTPFQYNQLYSSQELPSFEKNGLKQSLVPQPSSHSSFFQGQSILLDNSTETPALNTNSISLHTYTWPSSASEKPSTTKVMHSVLASNNAETTTQPANLSFEKEMRDLEAESNSFERTAKTKYSVDLQGNPFLPLNFGTTGVGKNFEETRSERNSEDFPNLSNEAAIDASVSNLLRNEIVSNNLSSTGARDEQTSAKMEKQISATEDVMGSINDQIGSRRNLMDVLNETSTSETTENGKEQKQLFDTRDDTPNTLVVQISTIHQDRSIETPQVDPSGNLILFPIASLIQKIRNPVNMPYEYNKKYANCSNCAPNSDKFLEQQGQESTSVAKETNNQSDRRNKILDVSTLNLKQVKEDNSLQLPSMDNENSRNQTKDQIARKKHRNIVIRLPNGQELVIDVSNSRASNKINSSGSQLREVPLSGVISEQTTQAQNVPKVDTLPRDTEREEKALSSVKSDIEVSVSCATSQEETKEGSFLAPNHRSLEQDIHVLPFNNLNNIYENSLITSVQEFFRPAKVIGTTDIKHASDDDITSSTIANSDSLQIPEDESLHNSVDQRSIWPHTPGKSNKIL